MNRRTVALLSGGLDSMLSIRIMQDQNIEVEALHFRTIFTCCKEQAGQAARSLGVRLTVIGQEDDYLNLVKRPKYGYGKGANPCVDCRIYMFAMAKKFMERVEASFIISGEVVGQRPMSQKFRDLKVIAEDAGLKDLLLRPLSAKLLPPTLPERTGLVDRSRLHAFQGRSRKELIALAQHYGFPEIPTPSTGCALTEKRVGDRVFDLIEFDPDSRRWDFELLRAGRHFRYDAATKVVVGKDAEQNEQLRWMAQQQEASPCTLIEPANFTGPTALVVGPCSEDVARFAGGLILRYSKRLDPAHAQLVCQASGRTWHRRAEAVAEAEAAETV